MEQRPGPRRLQIGPSDACNARCAFCYEFSPLVERGCGERPLHAPVAKAAGRGKMLREEVWLPLVDDLVAMGSRQIDYVGLGEPLLNPAIGKALYHGRGRIRQTMITNGYLLDRYLDPVADCLDSLNVSLNAGTPETLSRIQGCDDSMFDRVVDSVRELKRRGTPVGFSLVVNKQNFREVSELSRLCRDLDVTLGITPLGVYPETEAAMAMDAGERAELFDLLLELAAHPGHKIANIADYIKGHDRDTSFIMKRIPCYIGYVFCQIRGDGSVAFCCACSVILGNVNDHSFPEIWGSRAYEDSRQGAMTGILETQQPLAGCHCFICGKASENVEIHNQLHGTVFTVDSLREMDGPLKVVSGMPVRA